MELVVWDSRQLTEEQARAIAELLVVIWPKPDKTVETRTASLLRRGAEFAGEDRQAPRSAVATENGRVLAHAALVSREIGTEAGPITIAGLAQVCTSPESRGSGLGREVVRRVFAAVDDGDFPLALFQTSHGVQPFYERMGACLVENRVWNSLGDDPEATPFWDDVVMRYPSEREWPEGPIDLRGPGY